MQETITDEQFGNSAPNSLSLNAYQVAARGTDQSGDKTLAGLAFPLLGLFGEVGTLLSALKKKQRDRDSYIGYNEAVVEEFGDVLWYFCNIASRVSLNLSVLAQRVFLSASNWDDAEVDQFATFSDIQREKNHVGSPDSPAFETAVISLAGKVGLLLNDFSLNKIAANRDVLSAHLVDIFRALIHAANVADVDLQGAASANIEKINSRWPLERHVTPLFDEGYDPTEQLPRLIRMHIIEKTAGSKVYVIQRCNDINIGSRLTDNKVVPDDYRFHDVFHLAYAAILGWSPVIRALFKVKRKSRPEVDESQDGARAILIEEGVSTLIFHHGLRLNYFASIRSLDYPLLKLIRDFVSGYEVEKCPLWLWEKAILDGFAVFRKFRTHRTGIVIADLVNRSITFEPER